MNPSDEALLASIPVTDEAWQPSYRLIASRFPTAGLYDQIADPADLEVVFAIESLTNPRLRQELGELSLVRPADRVSGPGSTPIMAAFTHLNPDGSRFSNGSWGVYYAADRLETAVAEVSHHRARFLSYTREGPIDLDLRLILADVVAPMHDLRQWAATQLPAVEDPEAYGTAQILGQRLRERGSWGAYYRSVRDPDGHCVAVWRPRALGPARVDRHLGLHWDGRQISHWYVKERPEPVRSVSRLVPLPQRGDEDF
ncbi:RES family NAD+ phosphorylase [Sphaerotilus microaerophilus]|uniref:RES domain-containing protein n=1 Tax=Sphaerotilus microaerophilus TaxID=2914710 RepID=A0ABN6PKV2_9BURK|nr:RES family NAD+ phosphorylase [Sphaerotilus sp. FB-5]BDI05821.1 hypothetical protein CATMQ487_27910 [Sphaerotilus sp. FB-5]